jgi:putative transposase
MDFQDKYRRGSVRLKGYDYGSDGAYFITICSYKRQLLFGEIQDEKMIPNDIGKIIYSEWVKTEEIRKYITLGVYQLMPNHFHGIIFIHKDSEGPLPLPSSVIFSRIIISDYRNEFKSQSNNLSSVIRGFKSAVTTSERKNSSDGNIWQSRFHEHIIRNQEELERIERYIQENPTKWKDDRYYT